MVMVYTFYLRNEPNTTKYSQLYNVFLREMNKNLYLIKNLKRLNLG